MDNGDSKNVHWSPRLQRQNVQSKKIPQPCSFSVIFGRCSPGLPCTFLESLGSTEYCYVFGLPISWGSLCEVKTHNALFGLLRIDNNVKQKKSLAMQRCIDLWGYKGILNISLLTCLCIRQFSTAIWQFLSAVTFKHTFPQTWRRPFDSGCEAIWKNFSHTEYCNRSRKTGAKCE